MSIHSQCIHHHPNQFPIYSLTMDNIGIYLSLWSIDGIHCHQLYVGIHMQLIQLNHGYPIYTYIVSKCNNLLVYCKYNTMIFPTKSSLPTFIATYSKYFIFPWIFIYSFSNHCWYMSNYIRFLFHFSTEYSSSLVLNVTPTFLGLGK